MAWSGADMRCPKCNKYLPDRCTCATTRTSMRIMGSPTIPSIPWSAIAGHERQAMQNHGQTLERLAERGGLGACEAVAIIEDRRWHRMDKQAAENRLTELCATPAQLAVTQSQQEAK